MSRNKHEAEPSEQRLQTVAAVSEFLCLSRSKIYNLMDSGQLPYVKLGKSRRVRWSDVLKLVEANTISGAHGNPYQAGEGSQRT